ncbi:MAG TPA: N-acetyltransferase [Rhizomicrobium sp.]
MADVVKEAAWQIRAERAEDAPLVDALNVASFGPGRYVRAAYRLREGVAPESQLSFVALEDGAFRASVRFWPIFVGAHKALLLGPLAVQSSQRGRGIGIALMKHGIEAAHATDYSCILLVGDEPYYVRAGFTRLPPRRVHFPGPVDASRILGLSLKPDVLLTLSGDIRRAHIADPVCADGAPLGKA